MSAGERDMHEQTVNLSAAQDLLQEAAVLHGQGRIPEAIVLFRKILAMRPEITEGWYELGYLLKAQGQYEEALEAFAEALRRGVKRPEEVHLNRGVIYSDHLRRDAAAASELEAALTLNPNYVPALLNLGNLHEERGERDAALSAYDRVLARAGAADNAHQDLCLEALARSANLRPPSHIEDPILAQLEQAAITAAQYGHVVRANVLFMLGHSYDKLGAYDQAFDAYARGNRCLLRQTGRSYDHAQQQKLVDAMIEVFQTRTENLAALPQTSAVAPLFICGMFRSGSTLIEQVLAAHPLVTPGGELDFLIRLAAEKLAPFPASVALVDPARDAEYADQYRAHVAQLFPEGVKGSYITDKRPDNFLLIGFIKRLFPNAKIVHTTRHPIDNGLSVYLQHLVHQVAPYSSDLVDIGHYYGEYRRLMAHWKAIYPDSIFDFDYDDFVRNPKPALERLYAFLGLNWDDDALNFHKLKNTVKTASYWQVRKPLYASASGRWRNYESFLAPLRAALLNAGIEPSELE